MGIEATPIVASNRTAARIHAGESYNRSKANTARKPKKTERHAIPNASSILIVQTLMRKSCNCLTSESGMAIFCLGWVILIALVTPSSEKLETGDTPRAMRSISSIRATAEETQQCNALLTTGTGVFPEIFARLFENSVRCDRSCQPGRR